MCGVFGMVGNSNRDIARRVCGAMHHRGPDDNGIWFDDKSIPVTLVNTRLAILDLSDAGHMPMQNNNGDLVVTYNGEIYNFPEIRDMLESLGYSFVSQSDTEVLLTAYEHWGEGCIDHFRGMFAFVIWDIKKQKLFAARDRLGIKPLYWSMVGDCLLIGSEIKTLLSTGLIDSLLDQEALHHYLTFYAVPPPLTMIQDIKALLPGHALTWESGSLSIKQYWDLPVVTSIYKDTDSYDVLEMQRELRNLLEESIKLRMVADVPVGAFLSGGLDSSAVVALMATLSGNQLKTFSIGYDIDGTKVDERYFADLVAKKYDTEHHEIVVTGQDVASQLSNFVSAMDQPSGDGLNTFLVSQATSQHVKVALSGLGGDELFAGYNQYRYLMYADNISALWGYVPKQVKGIARHLFNLSSSIFDREALADIPNWLESHFLERYLRTRTLFNEDIKTQLYSSNQLWRENEIASSIDFLKPYINDNEQDSIVKVTRLELKSYLSHMLLRDTDVTSMSHSLEVRVPLIDHKLVEFALNIPPSEKLDKSFSGNFSGRGKKILSDVLSDLLPDEILMRKKQGFFMPVNEWLRNDLNPILSEALSDDSVSRRGLFDPVQVRKLRNEFDLGQGSYMRIWALLMLELWQREFVD